MMAERKAKASSSTVSYEESTASAVAKPVNGFATHLQVIEPSQAQSSTDTEAPQDELWSSILNSVKRSRTTPVKKIIVLGSPRSGKSTLINRLAAASPSGFISSPLGAGEGDDDSPDVSITSAPVAGTLHRGNLGLSYGYFDVADDDGDDSIARVGVYQLSSAHPSVVSLLPFALLDSRMDSKASKVKESRSVDQMKARPSADGLRDTALCIVLDWESPWDFLAKLIEWLDVVAQTVGEVKAEVGDAELEALQADLERYVRAYSEPAANVADTTIGEEDAGDVSVASGIVAVSNPTMLMEDEIAPLPEGCLTRNLGVPLVVICNKADAIVDLERKRSFKEEQFDYIQQVLRTICMKYGAGLFFTAQTRPSSYDVLRDYILHRLFSSPSSKQVGHATALAFQFKHRASTVERDVLVVPAGWDSFGKIRALREGFDCASMANGWEWDLEVERIRRAQGLERGSSLATEKAEQEVDRRTLPGLLQSEAGSVSSSLHLYEDIIVDWDAAGVTHNNAVNGRVKEPDEQAFLLHHYNAQQREPEPRSRSARPGLASGQAGASTVNLQGSIDGGADGSRRRNGGVVGPMGSAGLSLPSVERAMQERQLSDEASRASPSNPVTKPAARRDIHAVSREHGTPRSSTPTPGGVRGAGSGHASASSGVQSPSSRPTSPLNQGAGSPSMSTPKQSEVLHSFFQSLLKEKPASGGAGTGTSSRQPHSSASSSRGNAGKN